jgi:hypothetical protein
MQERLLGHTYGHCMKSARLVVLPFLLLQNWFSLYTNQAAAALPLPGASGKHVCNWVFEKCTRTICRARPKTGTLMRRRPLKFQSHRFHSTHTAQFQSCSRALSRAVPEQFQSSSRRILFDPGGSYPLPIHFQAGPLPELKHDLKKIKRLLSSSCTI